MQLRRVQQGRPQADRGDGRRHHQGRRPIRQGRGQEAESTATASPPIFASIRRIFERFLTFGGRARPMRFMVDNAEMARCAAVHSRSCAIVGRHFTINRMLTFDSVKLRLEREQPLTFLEFNYMILQAYDFPRAVAPGRAASCSSAARTNGAISSTASSSAAGSTAPSSTASPPR